MRSDAKRSVEFGMWPLSHHSVSTYPEHPSCARLYPRHGPPGGSATEKRTKVPPFSAPFICHSEKLPKALQTCHPEV